MQTSIMEKSSVKKAGKEEAFRQRQGMEASRKKPIKLWKFRGYKELVPDPYGLGL